MSIVNKEERNSIVKAIIYLISIGLTEEELDHIIDECGLHEEVLNLSIKNTPMDVILEKLKSKQ